MQIGTSARPLAVLGAAAALVGLVGGSSLPAQAAIIDVELRVDNVLVDTLDETDLGAGCTLGGAIESCTLTDHAAGGFLVDLSLLVGENGGQYGFFGAGLVADNTGVSTSRLTVDLILEVGPLGPSTTTGGSVAPNLTDSITGSTPNNGATIASVLGSSFYTAEIDGTLFSQTLYDHPQNLTVSTGSPCPYSVTNPTTSCSYPGQDFGLPGITQPGPAVGSTIRIRYDFTLTSEDQAGLNGQFKVVPIPEPGTALLLGLGLMLIGLAKAPRRR